MATEMQGLLLTEFTIDEFEAYCRNQMPGLMKAWRPDMIVLHNTGKMAWPGMNPKTHEPLSTAQRVLNMSVTWTGQGWKTGPHFLLTPKPSIVLLSPFNAPGTHSPSWNHFSWGIEMVGDFDLEPFPDATRDVAVRMLKALYGVLGREPKESSFRLHKEDPKTAHKHCPGANTGTKAQWLARLTAILLSDTPVDLPHARAVPAGTGDFIGKREGEVLIAYVDGANPDGSKRFALGFGTQIKPDGTRVKEGETCTHEQAVAWRDYRIQSDWDHIQQLVTVPISDGMGLALLSWCYEFNVGQFATSTMLKRINAGDTAGAQASFAQWHNIRVNGVLTPSDGLKKRRAMELALWNGAPALVAVTVGSPAKPLPTAVATKPAPAPGTAPAAPPKVAKVVIPIEAAPSFVATTKTPAWLVPIIAKLNELVAKAA